MIAHSYHSLFPSVMEQKLSTSQRLHQSPQQYLISTMVQSSNDELEQLINKELQENVTLEAVDPAERFADDHEGGSEDNDYADASDDGRDPAEADASLSNSDRGDAVSFEHDDDEPADTSSQAALRGSDGEDFNPVSVAESEQTFRENLKQQIGELEISDEEQYLAQYLIDCLDNDGYLRRSLTELVDDLEFTQHHTTTEEDLEAVLVEVVQTELEPCGLGARTLQECLLLQLDSLKGTPANLLAFDIVKYCFDDFIQKRYDRIVEKLGITSHQLFVDANHAIRHLNPKPGNMQPVSARSQEERSQQIVPDFIVRNEEGQLVVTLCDDDVPVVRISAEHEQMLADLQKTVEHQTLASKSSEPNLKAGSTKELKANKEGIKFLRDGIQRGNNFIEALQQRHNTLLQVMQTIVRLQRAYFLTGQIDTLRPMTLRDVAELCDYDITTISRATSSRFCDTEFGVIALKDLFTNAVGDSTQSTVLDALRQIIQQEDKTQPMSDDALAQALCNQGFDVARRTVMKYRSLLGFPVARMRKEVR